MLILPGPIFKGNAEHSQHLNNWNAPPLPLQTGVAHRISEPTPFDLATIPLSQNQEATLFLPADDATSLLQDVDYFALTEMGTTTWDGLKTADLAHATIDTFEKTYGSYVYPQ